MDGDIAAAGDLATGALVGRAMEPGGGKHIGGAHGGALCLNCGTRLEGEFCHMCGQAAHIHRTLSSIIHDVLHGVFHFDGKIWRTLPMLFSRPGALTRRYIAGERARFVSPLALFLFSVFLMVATFETIGGPFGSFEHGEGNGPTQGKAQIDAAQAKNKARQEALKQQRAVLVGQHADTAKIDRIDKALQSLREDNAGLQAARAISGTDLLRADPGDADINTGVPTLDGKIKKAMHSPELFLYKAQSSAYKFSWLLIPISLPFIWLLFAFRRDVGPYDHAIFAIYSLSAMTLGVVGLSVLRAVGAPSAIIGLIFTFGPPLHMYKQLRGAYRIGRFGAAWRTVALLFSASVAGLLFFVGMLGLAA